MNITKIEAALKRANIENFREAADYVTKTRVSDPLHGPALTVEDRKVISECMANDMATGAELTKYKYMLIGGATVLVICIATFITVKVLKKRKKEA